MKKTKGIQRVTRKLYELSALNRISKAINGVRDLDNLLDIIMETTVTALKANRGILLLKTTHSEEMEVKSFHGLTPEEVKKIVTSMRVGDFERIPEEESSLMYCTLTEGPDGKVLKCNTMRWNFLAEEREHPTPTEDQMIWIPLKNRDRVIGIIGVGRKKEPFDEGDLEFLSSLASNAIIAIKNAQLNSGMAATQEKLIYANRQLASLNRVSNLFRKIFDEERLFQVIPHILCAALDFDRASLFIERDGVLFRKSLYWRKERDKLKQLEALLAKYNVQETGISKSTVIHTCFEKGETIFVEDASSDTGMPQVIKDILQSKAYICTPIKTKNKTRGVLIGDLHYHDRKIDQQDIERFETFANMVGLTLENIQFYQTLEDKVEERTRELANANQELKNTLQKLKETQVQLIHSEKMASLGQLVAGVAHELNNPISFIYSNMEHLKGYIKGLKRVLSTYSQVFLSNQDDRELIDRVGQEVELDYILRDIDVLLNDFNEGAERTKQIVQDLRSFSRLDEAELKEVNIHDGIESTLNLLRNQYKKGIQVHKDYGELPLVECYASQLNQVFMNLLLNAAQAIEGKGDVWIQTRQLGDFVRIIVRDNGKGIRSEHLDKIFDPFFTTKSLGEGTGLGLSITYGIIRKHQGIIFVESEIGKGTTFTIELPVKQNDEAHDSGFGR
jgi:signal transduction histidine kinase